jgi:tRNA nucleotidyltransferase/poly(A) polymerase
MENTAIYIIKELKKHNFIAYFAGGYVRDLILKIKSNDIDIVTNALPNQIIKIFKKTFSVGSHFGVIIVHENGYNFEIASFRSDSELSDGRRPDFIVFSNPKDDAFRRDFTINGIFYDPIKNEYIDFINGKNDIKNKIIKFIGNPNKRIQEDFLRILRAVRFKNTLNFEYEKNTETSLKIHATALFNISIERIIAELNKMIIHKSRKNSFYDLYKLDILKKLIPEVEDMKITMQPEDHHSEGNVFQHVLKCLKNMKEGENLELYWGIFFHDIGKCYTKTFNGKIWKYPNHEKVGVEITKKIMNRLKFPKKNINKICWIIYHKQVFDQFFKMKLSRRLYYYDHKYFSDLIKLYEYDVKGSIPKGEINIKSKKNELEKINLIKENYKFAKKNKLLPSYKKEFLTGKEIIDITKLSPSKIIGEIKNQLREKQLEHKINSKEEAIKFVKYYKKRDQL